MMMMGRFQKLISVPKKGKSVPIQAKSLGDCLLGERVAVNVLGG